MASGSPPLVRERLSAHIQIPTNLRITPARAGKTLRLESLHVIGGDHPRSCGKDRNSASVSFSVWGSPPLVRERLVSIVMARLHVGITPARAGKTMHRRLFPGQCWDHPRSCGKDSPPTNLLRNGLGSPPLVRERRPVEADIK